MGDLIMTGYSGKTIMCGVGELKLVQHLSI